MISTDRFVKSIHRKIQSMKREGFYSREELAVELSNHNISRDFDDITDYDIAFWELFQSNKKVSTTIEKYLKLLSEQKYFRQDISSFLVAPMIREVRLPATNGSKWQLLYETLIIPTDESGPILHLYFDGWEIVNHKIYYYDETIYYDVDEETQNSEEERIYDKITQSAKKRFDYLTFEKGLNWPHSDIDFADKILWMILVHLTNGEKPALIAARILGEMLTSGFDIDRKSIEEFIKDNENNWKLEIATLKMATDMLKSNLVSVEQVHAFVSRMLNDNLSAINYKNQPHP